MFWALTFPRLWAAMLRLIPPEEQEGLDVNVAPPSHDHLMSKLGSALTKTGRPPIKESG